MDQLFKTQGLATALEIIILYSDAQSITSCRLVSTYLRNFIDCRKSLINHQRNLISKQLYHVFSKIKLLNGYMVREIQGPLTQYSLWRAILDHVCGLKKLGSIKAFLVLLKKYNVYMEKTDSKLPPKFKTSFTPLQFAMIDGDLETLQVILNSGMIQPVIEIRDNNFGIFSKTLFYDACALGTLKVVKIVLEYLENNNVTIGPVTSMDHGNHETFLHTAVVHDNFQVLPFLFELAGKKGININATSYFNMTIWHQASCLSGSLDMLKFLYTNAERYGIDLQATTPQFMRNVLHLACGCFTIGIIENISFLLSVSNSIGIDVNATDLSSNTLLHTACNLNRTEIAKLFLERSEEEYNLDFRKSFSTYNDRGLSIFELALKQNPLAKKSVDVELLNC